MGGMLDTLRFSYFVSSHMNVSPRKVESIVIGEHGESMVPLASQVRVDGRPLSEIAKPEEIREIIERTRKAGAEVIALKGSTFYAPSQAIALMAESIVKDLGKVLPASVFLQGEYGVSGVYAGVPAKLGKNGLDHVVELDLDDEERKAFTDSCEVLRGKAKELGLVE